MNITGVEVIRHNPGVVAIGVVAGEKIELTYDDTLRVNVSFDYRGLAMKTTLECAIGKLHDFPTPWLEVLLKSGVEIDLPESFEFTPYERSVDIPITDIDPGTDYDLSVSLLDYREAGHPTIVDVIDIVGVPPEYERIQETIYPFAYVYEGWQETCVYTLTIPLPEQIGPPAWIGGLIANAFANKIEEQGERVLELRVYADTTPTFWTNYRIEVTSTTPTEGTSGIAFPWAAVIIGVIVILGIIVLTWAIEKIYKLFVKPKPLSEEIKKAMSRESLISLIGDFEAKLELTPTPPEELEGKSDEELRDYCDELAEKVVPPVPDMWPLVALAILGVGGLGAVAAGFLLTKPE